jgi:hypothetical protein
MQELQVILTRRRLIGSALGLTLAQICFSMFISGDPNLNHSYKRLCQWDCGWYASITEDGYHSPYPPSFQDKPVSNVAFFPGYPITARIVHLSTGIESKTSLLLVAQVGAGIFWLFFFLILERWQVSLLATWLCALSVIAHPASFYLIAPYSESLFLCGLLGMIYFCSSTAKAATSFAGISGFIMTATRIVGMPLAFYPVFIVAAKKLLNRGSMTRSDLKKMGWITFLSVMGAISFFIYCRIALGNALIYFETERIGWDIKFEPLIMFQWNTFKYAMPWDQWSHRALLVLLGGFTITEMLVAVLGKAKGLAVRLPLYLCVIGMEYINISGRSCVLFASMIRYTLPCIILLSLCAGHISTFLPRWRRRTVWIWGAVWAASVAAIVWFLQVPHLVDYLHGRWFA